MENWKKRLEQIETHLAKLNRKDIRVTKSSQRLCLNSSTPNNELEKKLGRIETLLAKLTKDSKSKSGRVHMATVDEQPDSVFSDNDASEHENGDFNSDNSLVESDSEKHGMNIYITHRKKS